MAAATVAELEALQDLIATRLTSRIKDGVACPRDIGNAVRLLKQCGIKVKKDELNGHSVRL